MRFLDGIGKEQKGLEIGPSHSPVVSKKDGYQVETLDWLDQAGLREHYRNEFIVTLQKTEEKTELDFHYRQQLLRKRDRQNKIF